MRAMENTMRQTRSMAAGLRSGGDADGFRDFRARYRFQYDQYRQFCAHFGLKPDMQRVYADGIGKIL